MLLFALPTGQGAQHMVLRASCAFCCCCFFVSFCLLFLSKLLLSRSCWPQTVDCPASACWMPGSQVCATTSCCVSAETHCCSSLSRLRLSRLGLTLMASWNFSDSLFTVWCFPYILLLRGKEFSNISVSASKPHPLLTSGSTIPCRLCPFLWYILFCRLKSEMGQGPENTVWPWILVRAQEGASHESSPWPLLSGLWNRLLYVQRPLLHVTCFFVLCQKYVASGWVWTLSKNELWQKEGEASHLMLRRHQIIHLWRLHLPSIWEGWLLHTLTPSGSLHSKDFLKCSMAPWSWTRANLDLFYNWYSR